MFAVNQIVKVTVDPESPKARWLPATFQGKIYKMNDTMIGVDMCDEDWGKVDEQFKSLGVATQSIRIIYNDILGGGMMEFKVEEVETQHQTPDSDYDWRADHNAYPRDSIEYKAKEKWRVEWSAIDWRRENIEPPGNGKIILGPPEGTAEVRHGKIILNISICECAPGTQEGMPFYYYEITDAYLEKEEQQWAPNNLLEWIDLEGCRMIAPGIYANLEGLTISKVAAFAHCTRDYIKQEINAKRLAAHKVGTQYEIEKADFLAWADNPRRGSRRHL